MTTTEIYYEPVVLSMPAYNCIGKVDRKFNKPVILSVNDLPSVDLPESSLNVYIDIGEPSVWCCSEEKVLNRNDLDLLITKRTALLDNSSCKSILLPFGTCWTKNENKNKKFEVSFLMTSPHDEKMNGYVTRHALWQRKNEISIPKNFFNSSRRPVEVEEGIPPIGNNENDKEKLFDSMFSIAIENTKEENYFSEKIIDCLQSKTIPVYFGCPNIGDYFNTEGMILVENENDIINICNSLSPKYYENHKDIIEENYNKSIQYTVPLYKRVFDTIQDQLGLKSTPIDAWTVHFANEN